MFQQRFGGLSRILSLAVVPLVVFAAWYWYDSTTSGRVAVDPAAVSTTVEAEAAASEVAPPVEDVAPDAAPQADVAEVADAAPEPVAEPAPVEIIEPSPAETAEAAASEPASTDIAAPTAVIEQAQDTADTPVAEVEEPASEILPNADTAADAAPANTRSPTDTVSQIEAALNNARRPAISPSQERPEPEAEINSEPEAQASDALVVIPLVVESAPESVADEPNQTAEQANPAPQFDLVRVENDGATVIAGRAEPGSEVTVTADGAAIGTATATARGEFVAIVDTPRTGVAQEIRLQTGSVEGGDQSTSQEAVIVILDAPQEPEADPAQVDEGAADEATPTTAPVVLLTTPEAVEVIQAPTIQPAGQIVFDAISYSAEGQVMLSGRGTPGNTARIYANDIAVARTDIGQDAIWSAVIATLDPGDYTLRVDEIGADGRVISRAESPFRRVTRELAIANVALADPLEQIVVQPGNNLWTIARERYGEGPLYTQIFTANADQIRDPNLIFPGQIFSLPSE